MTILSSIKSCGEAHVIFNEYSLESCTELTEVINTVNFVENTNLKLIIMFAVIGITFVVSSRID